MTIYIVTIRYPNNTEIDWGVKADNENDARQAAVHLSDASTGNKGWSIKVRKTWVRRPAGAWSA